MTTFYISSNFSFLEDLKVYDATIRINQWTICIIGSSYKTVEISGRKVYIIGDLINQSGLSSLDTIKHLKGIFYLIEVYGDRIRVLNSLFSVLPLYHNLSFSSFSNDMQWLKTKYSIMDKTYLLENILLNYGISNATYYSDIKLLPTNHYIQIDTKENKVLIKRHLNIEEYFAKEINPKIKKNEIAEKFIEVCKEYFPNEKYAITFTAGFDGRTLVACSRYYNKSFYTCSAGAADNPDIIIPKDNAQQLGMEYYPIDLLSKSYITNQYLEHSLNMLKLLPGSNAFIYPHFNLISQQCSSTSRYLLTGYFGSELFRALHISGAVTSDVIVELFKSKSQDKFEEYVINNPRLKVLNISEFRIELVQVIQSLWNYKRSLPKELNLNQQFYTFIFNEALRRNFGMWINAQFQYLNVRVPYMDFGFIEKLLFTPWAGVNNPFLIENPIKRMRGQLIYAEVIKRTDSGIFHQVTGKGYSPSDLLNPFGLANVIKPYLMNKINHKIRPEYLDNLGIISGIQQNKDAFMDLITSSNTLFNKDWLITLLSSVNEYMDERNRDILLHSIAFLKSENITENAKKNNSTN